ncbi:MAG: hypothetical protein ACREN7_09160 [Candidatus Dormibacteria bacterium]
MGELASGGVVSAETVRKLACTGRIVWMLRDASGLLGIGRSSRTIAPLVSSHLKYRDHGPAASPAAGAPGTWMPTTSCTGPTVARPT